MDDDSILAHRNGRTDWSDVDDATLLAAVAERDRNAFVALFERYAGRIKGFLIRAGASDGVAEEATQEVMVTLWRRAETFDPSRAGASTWIFTIARNKRIDLLRRAGRTEIDVDDPALFQPEPAASAEVDVAGAERDARVRDAVLGLSEEQREVVRLAFFSGLSHADIAAQLTLPLGTVKSRLRLAFTKLRDDLGAGFVEELRDG
ncbi:MAG: sigma-70 family RNA polymerase sigma factor [Pseudomonadota bacterium]